MDDHLVRNIWRRAGHACEYCRIPQQSYPVPFQIDHIVARQHGGVTNLANLAIACLHCNGHKGPNIAGIDPKTKRLTALFNPRRHKWDRHFRYRGALLTGRTAVGRTTIAVLNMNGSYLLQLRQELLQEGSFPLPHV